MQSHETRAKSHEGAWPEFSGWLLQEERVGGSTRLQAKNVKDVGNGETVSDYENMDFSPNPFV